MQSGDDNRYFSLKGVISEEQLQWFFVLCSQVVFIGFVSSRALSSVGMMALLVSSVLYYGPAGTFKSYFAKKELWILSLFFWLVFISGIYSEDKHDWLNWVRIKLPYIALPLAFAPLKKLSSTQLRVLIYGFILVFVISAAVILGNYFLNYESITDSFSRGNGIPMPYSHIRYTLMLAFSFFCCIWMAHTDGQLFFDGEKWLLALLALLVFIALHILSVRSALLALYIGIVFLAVREAVLRKKFVQSFVIIAVVAALPYLAYRYVPSFHNKIEYMKWDMQQYREGKANDYSDAMRMVSVKIGFSIWKENPLFGVGAGDLKTETNHHYAQDYPDITDSSRRIPHNQFIWVLATTGVFGFLLFVLAFFYPWLAKGHYKLWILTVLHLILLSSFFTEDTLEEQIGTGFYLVFLLVFMNYCRSDE